MRKAEQKSFRELNLMPIRKAAPLYYCSVREMERAIQRGLIDCYKPGKERLIDVETADKWAANKKVRPSIGTRKR